MTAKMLEEYGFEVETGAFGLPTCVVGRWGKGHPVIGLLGELDALPDLSQKVQPDKEPVNAGEPGHGCGHNLLNAASALCVDSCWIHRARETFDLPEGKALLKKWGLPETLRGVGNCILGYAAAEPTRKPRKPGRIIKID